MQAIPKSVQINRHIAGNQVVGIGAPAAVPMPAIPGEHFNAVLDAYFTNNYTVTIGDQVVRTDARANVHPGDLAIVWPKRRGPALLRKLAKRSPFRDYYFATAAGDTIAVPIAKVVAIHRVVDQTIAA